MSEPTFLVDKKGLAKLLARKGKGFIITELLQNAWDEEGVTTVQVTFEQANGRARLTVADDAPEGFSDLSHAYTLFAESKKKGDAEKRGRFNLGEKLVIAICDTVKLATTKGTVIFDETGRTMSKAHTTRGTLLECNLKMNAQEAAELRELAATCIPPPGRSTFFNGEEMPERKRLFTLRTTLPTEIADEEGNMRGTARQTYINLYDPLPGEKAMLYELGIPVVETGDRWHIDVQQKVPLNSDRDNVTPSYLQKIRTTVVNEMANWMATNEPEKATASWVSTALEDPKANPEAVRSIITARYGDKVVISDPSDPEGTKLAVAQGYTVLPPRTFNHEAWVNVKAAGIKPAGQVTPSDKPYVENGRPEKVIEDKDLTPAQREMVHNCTIVGAFLTDRGPQGKNWFETRVVNEPTVNWVANYGAGSLCLNLGRLGKAWFEPQKLQQLHLALLIHECAHELVSDHLSSKFYDECCRLGAKLAVAMGEGRPSLLRCIETPNAVAR